MSLAIAPDTFLVGRDDELDQLIAVLDAVDSTGTAVALVGEPGVGKSALQSHLAQLAANRDFVVLQARGSEAETHLPFACLHQLIRPLFPRLEQLSSRQRQALLAAFGMGDGTTEPFLISLAVLELIIDAGRCHPVLVSLDDLHWMDGPSLDALGFLARRLAGERVIMVVSTRPGVNAILDDPAVMQLHVDGLPNGAAGELLERTSPNLPPAWQQQIIEAAQGNPLALIEFPLAMPGGGADPTKGAVDLPMTVKLERAFTGRVHTLPAQTQTVLTVSALSDSGDLAEVIGATRVIVGKGINLDTVQPAIDAGLVQVAGSVIQFRHTLVRSAIRHSTPLAGRIAAHAALAEVLVLDPDRAAWHRAAGSTTLDESIAAALEAAAGRAVRRGAVQSAVAWLQRASAMSPDQRARGSRLLRAAELAFELGQYSEVKRLMAAAREIDLLPSDRARLTWLEGVFDDGTPGDGDEIHRLIDLAVDAVRSGDPDLAGQLMVGATRRVWWGDPGAATRQRIVSSAREIGLDDRDPRLLVCLAVAEPFECGHEVRQHLGSWSPDAEGQPEWAGLLGLSAFCAGDFGAAIRFLSSPVESLRSQGRVGLLAQALTLRAWSAIYLGSFDSARSADEAIRLADETCQPVWGATARIAAAVLAGLRGESSSDRLLDEAGRVAAGSRVPLSSLLARIQLARGIADLGAGRYESAYGNLRRMYDPREPGFHDVQRFWSFSYVAEAAAHCGRRREGRLLLADLERLIGDLPCPTAEMGMFFANTVLAEDDSADEWYQASLIGPGSDLPWHRARVQLNYGSWLRRHRRTRDSRDHLRAARHTFQALGATAWADRADLELRATGEKGWTPAMNSWDLLSPQEAQIAKLAAQGLSNKEISERLFVSHRTVGSHLHRMFPKLGITSRVQLASALPLSPAIGADPQSVPD